MLVAAVASPLLLLLLVVPLNSSSSVPPAASAAAASQVHESARAVVQGSIAAAPTVALSGSSVNVRLTDVEDENNVYSTRLHNRINFSFTDVPDGVYVLSASLDKFSFTTLQIHIINGTIVEVFENVADQQFRVPLILHAKLVEQSDPSKKSKSFFTGNKTFFLVFAPFLLLNIFQHIEKLLTASTSNSASTRTDSGRPVANISQISSTVDELYQNSLPQ